MIVSYCLYACANISTANLAYSGKDIVNLLNLLRFKIKYALVLVVGQCCRYGESNKLL